MKDIKIKYIIVSNKNEIKKTEAVLGSWFDPTWAKHYIDTVLFDLPKPFLRMLQYNLCPLKA